MTETNPLTVNDLDAGDRLQFTADGAVRTVTRNRTHPAETGLRLLSLERVSRPSLESLGLDEVVTTLGTMPVIPVRVIRKIYVPCVTWRHGEDLVPVLVNLADGPVPRAVICGTCEGEINVELANEALRREA